MYIKTQSAFVNNITSRFTILQSKGWYTLATESEAESESEAQGALRSSVNQKSESETESEARRNRSQKDQKCFFFFRFRFRFRRFRSSENRVNGIGSGSGIVSQSKTHYQQSLVISRVRHLECLQIKARLTLKARLTIPLPSCRFTLDQNFLPIPSPLTTPLPSLPSLPSLV